MSEIDELHCFVMAIHLARGMSDRNAIVRSNKETFIFIHSVCLILFQTSFRFIRSSRIAYSNNNEHVFLRFSKSMESTFLTHRRSINMKYLGFMTANMASRSHFFRMSICLLMSNVYHDDLTNLLEKMRSNYQ